jgi:LmbE family N-acetylglucosaminyl deacetylase
VLKVKRIVLSPHLDDGVLSCGGAASAWVRKDGEASVEPLTFFAGSPDRPLTNLAIELNAKSGFSATADLPAVRRKEDPSAWERLGVTRHHRLSLHEALHRFDEAGSPRCLSWDDTALAQMSDLHTVNAVDDALTAFMRQVERAESYVLYAPVSLGDHIDHQIVRRAAEQFVKRCGPSTNVGLRLYEDLPYAFRIDDAARRRLLPQGRGDDRELLTADDLNKWIEAIEAYVSQSYLFDTMRNWKERLRAHTTGADGVYELRSWSPRQVPLLPMLGNDGLTEDPGRTETLAS